MNERINELKRMATLWCDDNIPEQFSEETGGYGGAWEDKFAELIVKECCNVLYDNELGGYQVNHVLKEHFGVDQ